MAREHLVAAIAVIWAGCGAAAQLGVTTHSTTTTAAAPSAVAGPGGAPSSLPDSASGGAPAAAPTAAPVPAASAPDDQRLVVPDLIGKTPDEARAIARAAGFTSEVELAESVSCPGGPTDEGRIRCQDPEPGKRTNRYAMIQIAVYTPQRFSGMILPRQLATLRGLTVDEARERLRQFGHDGPIRVHVSGQYAAGCANDKVCDVGPGGARGLHDEVVLFVKPKLDIAVPAP